MRRRRALLLLCSSALVGAAVVVGFAGSAALSAAAALDRARSDLVQLDGSSTNVDEAQAALRSASAELAAARGDLGHWSVDLLATVPVVRRSLVVERAVVRTATGVVDGATVLAEGLPSVSAGAGGIDLTALAAVERAVEGPARDADRALDDLRAAPTGLTPPQVGAARRDALAALDPAVATLRRSSDGLRLLGGLFGAQGDRSVLVMLQNNAELRGAGGYASSFATGRTSQGRLSLEPLQDLVDVADPPERARRVPAPAEYVEDYGQLSADTTIWRAWNMSPHVPDAALVSARIAGELLGREPDMVVLVDVPALARFGALQGGVVLPDGRRVSPQELGRALLVDAYEDAEQDGRSQRQRRVELQAAATSAVTDLLSGDLPVADVARAVTELVAGRHLTAWSARPEEQAALERLGAAGAVRAPDGWDLSHVSVNNIGANKIDVYVERELETRVVLDGDEALVVQRVRFTNRAPAGLVPYVAGVSRPGVAVQRVELSLPPGAQDVTASKDGGAWGGQLHVGLTRQRLSTRLEIPRGGTAVLETRYVLPVRDGTYRLRVLPQPLSQDARLDLSIETSGRQRLAAARGVELAGAVATRVGPLSRTEDIAVELVAPAA